MQALAAHWEEGELACQEEGELACQEEGELACQEEGELACQEEGDPDCQEEGDPDCQEEGSQDGGREEAGLLSLVARGQTLWEVGGRGEAGLIPWEVDERLEVGLATLVVQEQTLLGVGKCHPCLPFGRKRVFLGGGVPRQAGLALVTWEKGPWVAHAPMALEAVLVPSLPLLLE